ncbi:MAG TPA: NAD(P)/FAD-dependent oxidoreductase [Acidimicrobiales bacterium]
MPETDRPADLPAHVRVAIVGTGFAGLGMAIRLLQAGIRDIVVLDKAGDVGGTWRDNTYPGAACDVPSHLYSFSFAPNPGWSRSFSPQPEILAYLRGCADRFGVGPHLRLGHEVLEARWDVPARRWRITTSRGALTADVLVGGMGPLSEPRVPEVPGLDRFEGTVFHSARWRHDHDLAGERVAVVGTGASAIQFVPEIQPAVRSLHVFQRTPPWVIPRRERAYSDRERWVFRHAPPVQRAVRAGIYWSRELFVLAFTGRRPLSPGAARLAAEHLRRQVPDPELRARLTPDYTIGCKRILISNDWYPALTRPNVEVLTQALAEVRARSVVAADGTERPVDTIVFGTGFHVTDFPAGGRVVGAEGRTLSDVWRDQGGMTAYLGATVAGFPNLFLLIGPNTGLGHNSMVFMIESQLAYVLDCLRYMDRTGTATVDVRPDVQAAYNDELQRSLAGTVWNTGGCRSWYLDASGRNTTLWPDYTWRFRQRTRTFDPQSYVLGRRPVATPTAARAEAVASR